MTCETPKRPALRYHGGKWRLAPWIISHFPIHRVYVEPFGGAMSVLIRKPRTYSEVYNDLDGEIVNLFKVLRDKETGQKLLELLRLTPFARDEFVEAYEPSDNQVEQARRTVIKSYMGFGSAAITGDATRGTPTGFRSNSNRSGTTPAHDWANFPNCLPPIIERLQGVVIENKDGAAVMIQHDSPVTLHYVDPPYVHSTRQLRSNTPERNEYRHEMTNDQHRELAECLHGLKGMVILSGYPCELYDELYSDWIRIDKEAFADGAKKRTECLWLNPACSGAISGRFDFAEAS